MSNISLLLEVINDKTINDILYEYEDIEEKNILFEYFEFLYENEYIFFSKIESKYFPKYEINYQKPYNISCLIIDVSIIDNIKLSILKEKINETNVECIIFRFINSDLNSFNKVINSFNDISTRIIQIFIDDSIPINENNFEQIVNKNQRISIVVKYSCDVDDFIEFDKGTLIRTKKNVILENQNINDISDFDINIDLYMESHLYNNYFYRRVYINLNGDVSRHENDKSKFGNIKEINFENLLNDPKFIKYWGVKKDNIEICCGCEYRYMCVDGRLPMKKGDNLWGFETDCHYNPDTSEWKKSN